jgi:ComF family protein
LDSRENIEEKLGREKAILANYTMIRDLFYAIINTIIPPRGREAQVSLLTMEDLELIRHEDGLPYHDPRVTALIWELKYRANQKALTLAGALLSEELLGIAEEELGVTLLVPIPMHDERRKERGYNQTELLCEAALKNIGDSFEYAPHALKRIRHTAPQQTLARIKRLKNIKNSMIALDPAKIKGRICVVVDDVSTTGATLAEAARALKKAGAAKVHMIALARS